MLNIPISKEVVQRHIDALFNFINHKDDLELREQRANDAWCQILGMQKIVGEAERQFFVLPDIAKVDREALFEYFEIRDLLFKGLRKAEAVYEAAIESQKHRPNDA